MILKSWEVEKMKKKKNFTLIELLITVIIVGILATFAIPSYRNVIERAKAKTCQTNLQTLLGAVKVYVLEEDRLPATLGYLQDKHLERSWAKILQREDAWKIKLAYFIVSLDQRNIALAQVSTYPNYLKEAIALRCPADDNQATSSYQFASGIAGISSAAYKNLNDNAVIIEETATRHKHYKMLGSTNYGQKITKVGKIVGNSDADNLSEIDAVDSDNDNVAGPDNANGETGDGEFPGGGATDGEFPGGGATDGEFSGENTSQSQGYDYGSDDGDNDDDNDDNDDDDDGEGL